MSTHYYKAKQAAYLITQNKELAEEIVQDAFLICYQKLHLLRNPACFQTWFYKILVRMSKKALQKVAVAAVFSFR
ncbi:sigma factor [Brevibacillus thermoruber]|uniref:RNA polymerase sigma factor n=1 Tax=Brevibacillus thermoruber TaxID=33942 RepID=UPI0009DBF706